MKRLILVLTILADTQLCLSQTGAIKGLVYDGDTVNGVEFMYVTVLGSKIHTQTNKKGQFAIDPIKTGKYDIRFQLVGYGDTTVSDIVVTENSVVLLKIKLAECEYAVIGRSETCPVCHQKDSVIRIVYGEPTRRMIRESNKHKIRLGSKPTQGDPLWYCVRDKMEY